MVNKTATEKLNEKQLKYKNDKQQQNLSRSIYIAREHIVLQRACSENILSKSANNYTVTEPAVD